MGEAACAASERHFVGLATDITWQIDRGASLRRSGPGRTEAPSRTSAEGGETSPQAVDVPDGSERPPQNSARIGGCRNRVSGWRRNVEPPLTTSRGAEDPEARRPVARGAGGVSRPPPIAHAPEPSRRPRAIELHATHGPRVIVLVYASPPAKALGRSLAPRSAVGHDGAPVDDPLLFGVEAQGSAEVGVSQVGPAKVTSGELHLAQVGSREIVAFQVGTPQGSL